MTDFQPLYAVEDGNALPVELYSTPTLPQIKRLQDALAPMEQAECPLQHFFAPGMYVRQCTIPGGTVVVGKMHRHQHPVMLIEGEATINTDRGMERIKAPHVWISQENAKRALYTHSDCVFVTVHLNPSDITDLEQIEAGVIVPDALIPYDDIDAQAYLTDAVQGAYA